MKISLAKLSQVAEIEWVYSPSDVPIEGCFSTGNDEDDREIVREICERATWNEFAWFDVECRASFGGVSCSDYLGACSYDSEKDFLSGGYAEDMKENALRELQKKLEALLCDINGVCDEA